MTERYALDNLIVVVDDSQLQQFGWRDPGSGRRLARYKRASCVTAGPPSAGGFLRWAGTTRIFDLTTADQHIEQMGRLAVQILLRQPADSAGEVPTQEVLPTELLLRGSTEGAPVAS
ncbi:MAG TPA: hypothetical protein VMC83_04475 [Streptosporangiaceae bacterium]|nr:hypothetical protein [Streptosporangiaceae bacterium]